jgi:phosphate starvation-inducible PhoH-like protein
VKDKLNKMAENQSTKFKELTDKIREEKTDNPKGPIKFQLQLNEEQKEAKEKILSNAITILSGKAGSGKTLLACQAALDMLFKKTVNKIIITRPTVSKEEIGFLPGDLREKMEPWMQPIYSNFYQLYNKEKIDKILESGQVEIVPLAFMRGRTFLDAFIIVDEALYK